MNTNYQGCTVLTTAEEQQLLLRIAKADRTALAQLYKQYYPRLVRFINRMLARPDCAGEIINEVFLVIWEKAATFRGNSRPSTWILGITYKKTLKWAEKERDHQTWNIMATTEMEAVDKIDVLVEQHEINMLLDKLSAEQRAVIVLTYYFGYSYREISDILCCPENTVKTRMFHARKTLQRHAQTRQHE